MYEKCVHHLCACVNIWIWCWWRRTMILLQYMEWLCGKWHRVCGLIVSVCVCTKREDSDACSNNNTAVRNVISFYCYADNITENKSLKSGNGNVTSCASHHTPAFTYMNILKLLVAGGDKKAERERELRIRRSDTKL